MAKMLKQLVFGQKKNPPAPPRPDYEGDKSSTSQPYDNPSDAQFLDHDYENVSKYKCKGASQVRFSEKKESKLVVFDNYSEPADLRAEISTLEADPLYMSPLDDQGSAPPLEPPGEEEDMYCVPYDDDVEDPAPALPQPCLPAQGRNPPPEDRTPPGDATYDVVPDDVGSGEEEDDGPPVEDEYDEPWEWSVGARLTSSLQVSPEPSLGGEEEEDRPISDLEEEDMTARQQRRLLYETAFDSRVKRDADDLDRLMQQSPLFLNRAAPALNETVARAASRSSFGSTSGSSASSTPTHQPMEIARHSPHPFTPTERRKVTLVRDGLAPRSMSPRPRVGPVVNQNFERKISFSQWDSVSRCSGSDRSSSQESMSVELSSSSRNCPLGRSASRDSLLSDHRRNLTSNYPNNWKELTSAKLETTTTTPPQRDDLSSLVTNAKKLVGGHHPGVKVLPTDDSSSRSASPRFSKARSSKSFDLTPQPCDPELKENNSRMTAADHRPTSGQLPAEVTQQQSPENDARTSGDYDPPWDLKVRNVLRPSGGVNGSVSVPDRLSSSGGVVQQALPTSVTHDTLDEEAKEGPKAAAKPNRPNGGAASRPSLNLNLSSDSPRKGRQNLTLNFGCAALSAVGEKVDPQVTLEKQGWYHGSISRVDAEGKLRVLKEGSYLVRNSESSKQDYSLSLRSARGFMHMKIVPTSEGRFILGQFGNPFASIPEMIQHYSVNKLPIKGAEHMSLLYPVIDQLL